jgi:uncharacterized membrane protein
MSGVNDRWPAFVALAAIVALHWALPQTLTLGPTWLPALLVGVLFIPARLTDNRKIGNVNKWVGIALSAVVTIFMLYAVIVLVHRTLTASIQGKSVFTSAALLWLTNVLVFAIWYWRLDAGGPHERSAIPGHRQGAFFFPQMAMDQEILKATDMENWEPGFVDYLFLAFNTSTALSPADTGALSRWAKLLMMAQSLVSLTIIVLLAARAVNTL